MEVSHTPKLYNYIFILTIAKFISNIYTFTISPCVIIKGRNLGFIFYFSNENKDRKKKRQNTFHVAIDQ